MTSAVRAPQLKRRLTRRALGRMDPVTLAVMNNRLAAIAEEMGVVLGQTGYSPNIKERRDYSCALFDGRGELVAQAAHIPVHLGSTPLSVRAAIERLELQNGDVAVLNDPYAGGTHLPDVTVVMPVFLRGQKTAFAYVANRAHHADIGGMAPGSMALSTEIYQEGLRLPPVKLMVGGKPARDVFELFLANTRVREEREGDLRAQVAALQVGAERTRALVEHVGRGEVAAAMEALKDYADRLMRAALRTIKAGTYSAEDFLDDDGFGTGPIPVRVAIKIGGGRAMVDFTDSAPGTRLNQRKLCDYSLSHVLRDEVSGGRSGSRQRGPDAAHQPDRSSRHHRECSAARGGCGRECRNFAAHRRRAISGDGRGGA